MNYRQIYEQLHGPIPRGYEIHHIDGDRENDTSSNLMAVTLQEHYDIHLAQGDYRACTLIGTRLNKSEEEMHVLRSLASKKANATRLARGDHNFQDKEWHAWLVRKQLSDGTHPFLNREWAAARSKRLVDSREHPWQTEEHRETTTLRMQLMVADGSHHLLGGDLHRKAIAEGRFHSQKQHVCERCGRSGHGNGFLRWHGDRCKQKKEATLG